MRRAYNYVSPFIYPLFPEAAGSLRVVCNVKNVLTFRSLPDFTGQMTIAFTKVVNGRPAEVETVVVNVENQVPEIESLSRSFVSPDFGYVELSQTASMPLFDKPVVVQGYGLFVRPGRGILTFGSDLKYARDPIIQQVAAYGRFTLLHQSAYVDPADGIGNSYMLINPYRQAVVCSLLGEKGQKLKIRLLPGETKMQTLESLVENATPGSIMLSATNKITVFDVRHRYGDPSDIYNLDHLDFLNGWLTHSRVSWRAAARHSARRLMRRLGLRYA